MQSQSLISCLHREEPTLPSETLVTDILRQMLEQKLSAVVLVDEGDPVGIFTQRDAALLAFQVHDLAKLKIRQVMSSPLITVPIDSSLYAAYRTTLHHGIGHLGVLSNDGSFLGLVTQLELWASIYRTTLSRAGSTAAFMSPLTPMLDSATPIIVAVQHLLARNIPAVATRHLINGNAVFSHQNIIAHILSGSDFSTTPIGETTRFPVPTVQIDLPLSVASEQMLANGTDWLVVTDHKDKWLGLFSYHQMAKLARLDSSVRDNSTERLRQLYELAPLPRCSLDRQGVIWQVNRAWLDSLGYTKDEVTGCCVKYFLSSPQWIILKTALSELFEQKHQSGIQLELRCKDGTYREMQLEGAVLCDNHSTLQYAHCILVDITERENEFRAIKQSEQCLRIIAENIQDILWMSDPETKKFIYLSPAYERLWGKSLESAYANPHSFLDAVHAEDRTKVAATTDLLMQGNYSDTVYRLIRPEGDIRWVRDRAFPVSDEQGGTYCVVGIAQDVTEQKSAEQALKQKTSELQTFMNAVPTPAFLTDADLNLVAVNQAYCDFVGLSEVDIIGKPEASFLPSRLGKLGAAADPKILSNGQTLHNEDQLVRGRSDRDQWFSTSTTVVYSPQGEVTGLAGITFDISEHKQTEQQRFAREKQHRDALVREVHHRIKNHLQGVVGLLRQHTSTATSSTAKIEKSISQIKTIASVYGLQSEHSQGYVQMCDLINATIQSMQEVNPRVLHTQLDIVMPALLAREEAVPIALVINELFANAVKHSNKAEKPNRIWVNFHANRVFATLILRNRGSQLPKDFDFAAGTRLGTGLKLIRALLPRQGARLVIGEQNGFITASLELKPPVIWDP